MKKYDIMGHQMIKIRDLCHAIRILRNSIERIWSDWPEEKKAAYYDAYDGVVRRVFLEELKEAKTEEERDAILEMPGDFVVYKVGETRYDIEYFREWDNGKAVITRKPFQCMYFDYESMAKEVAERLGEGWEVLDASPEEHNDRVRLLNVLFGTTDDGEEEHPEEK